MEESKTVPEFQQVKETVSTNQSTVPPALPNQPGIPSTWPPTPQLETPKPKVSPWIYVLSVLIVALLGLAGYFGYRLYSQPTEPTPTESPSPTTTPDPTADWETYKGDGFEFRYPKDFLLEERDNGFYVLVLEKDKEIPQAGISIDTRQKDTAGLSLKTAEGSLVETNVQYLKNGIKVTGKGEPGGMTQGFSFIKASLRYKVGVLTMGTIDNREPYSDVFDEILSTFKFDETTNNYTNPAFGFSLKIPENWNDKYSTNTNTATQGDYVGFSFIATQEDPYSLFDIGKTSVSTWSEWMKDEQSKATSNYLGSQGGYVYFSRRSLDNPFSNPENIEAYHNMAADIENILSTFRFTD